MFGAAHNRPSWASMIDRQIDRPIPMPSGFVVKSGLNIRSMSCGPIPVPVSATETAHVAIVMALGSHRQHPRSVYGSHRIDCVRYQVYKHLLQLDFDRLLPVAGDHPSSVSIITRCLVRLSRTRASVSRDKAR